MDVVVVGSANLDVVVGVPHVPSAGETVLAVADPVEHPGGKGLNQAVAAARAGAGTALVATVGDDRAGALLRDACETAGVAVDALELRRGARTGTAHVLVQADGDNAIVVVPGANHSRVDLTAAGARAVDTARVLLVQLEVPPALVRAAAVRARTAGARVLLNAAPVVPEAGELLALVDVLLVNEAEARALTGTDDAAGAASGLAAGQRDVVVTLGAQGALVVRRDGSEVGIPSPPSDAVDTTGAGDAAAGALAAALAAGSALDAAVRRACAAGALAVRTAGAVPSMPDAASVDALLAGTATRPRRP
ncbi:PfkB family carbohydrate kinase [Aquipuribacter nitratireducens]|uniref:Ribokinase n=1 Tax=Aquipuribacter nitratireducens TaxID=650104 RepID=A0ABW0GNW7_9MICO